MAWRRGGSADANVSELWQASLLHGLLTTLGLLAASSALGYVLAVPLALARLSRRRWVAWPALAYSGFFRGTPLLVQIYLIYYGLAQFPAVRHSPAWLVLREAWPCALLALTLNMTAYVAEPLRGGLLAVPAGEREAALAFGMGRLVTLRRIVLPRAIRLVLPALGNEALIQLKSTALASTITLLDLTGAARRLSATSYSTEPLLIAGAIYVVLSALLGQLFRTLESGRRSAAS